MQRMRVWSWAVVVLGLALPAGAVSIDWVAVGLPGNAGDSETMVCCTVSNGTSGYGSVSYTYLIAETEVTNAQYAEFLNAVAKTDTNALYNTSMALTGLKGGISRSGGSGSYSYSAIAGREQNPVNHVSWYDSLRFANWLHNGQLTGAQDATTTEDGAYTFTGTTSVGTRNAGATIFLTSEDEWYKAAYHNAVGISATDYFNHPAGSDTHPTCSTPTGAANHANCNSQVGSSGDVVAVGSYTGSASPWGTFDQGGNVKEWTEAPGSSGNRVWRGGAWNSPTSPSRIHANNREHGGQSTENSTLGFRVASVPEPGTGLLMMVGMLGLGGWRRRRA